MAKLYVFKAGVDADLIWLVVIGVLNAVIAAYYYLRIVKLMYLGEPVSEKRVTSSPSLSVALSLACFGVLLLGIYPWLVLKVSETATRLFLP
jgi:NADH-quinone oxidoreductase subunit N